METIYYHFLMVFSFHSLIQYMSSDRCKWSVDPFDKISDWNSKQLMYFKICLWETPGLVLKVFCLNQLGKWEFFWPLGTRSWSIEKSRQNIICIVSCFQWILAQSVMSLVWGSSTNYVVSDAFFCFFNCTFAKWMHNPRQCNKASIEKTLFVAVFVWQVLNCNQKKKTKRTSAQLHIVAKYLSVFLFFVSIFSAKCSVVLVACFSNPSLSHVHMVCEAQYQLFVLSWLVCIFTF